MECLEIQPSLPILSYTLIISFEIKITKTKGERERERDLNGDRPLWFWADLTVSELRRFP